MTNNNHITVCICTYRRAELLKSLLEDLKKQETGNLFSYSILIVDNDRKESARDVVRECATAQTVRIDYRVEPEQNIALARNVAIAHATGDYVVFIDDDECSEIEDRNGAAGSFHSADTDAVRAALEALPLEFREALVLRELEGLSYKEIAEVAEVPLGTVMSRLARARRQLQGALDRKGDA